MRFFIHLLATLFVLTSSAYAKEDGRNLLVKQNASAGKRIALVIGNGNYQHADNLPKLANPTHDAEDIARALRGFGFEVIEKKDQSLEGMEAAITEFSRKIGDSDAALFYFAGHGLQVKGQNYIIPVDARIETEAQVPHKSINVSLILEEMDNGQSRANIVMLDACRNNPISGKFRSGATRGLAAPTSQPKGTVIVYATDPGNVAADGTGRNGLFTAGLLTAFKGNDLSLGGVLTRASEEVERGSEKKQTPYVNGPMTLQKSFQFGKGAQVASLVSTPAQPAAQVKAPEEIEDDTWSEAKGINTLEAYETYLSVYPSGRYVGQAKMKLAALKKPIANPPQAMPVTPTTMPAVMSDGYVSQGGLTWMPITFRKVWVEANSYCANTTIKGQSGWRLPTKDELVALRASGAINGLRWDLWYTWSSTSNNAGKHYIVDLSDGKIDFWNSDTGAGTVTCVR